MVGFTTTVFKKLGENLASSGLEFFSWRPGEFSWMTLVAALGAKHAVIARLRDSH